MEVVHLLKQPPLSPRHIVFYTNILNFIKFASYIQMSPSRPAPLISSRLFCHKVLKHREKLWIKLLFYFFFITQNIFIFLFQQTNILNLSLCEKIENIIFFYPPFNQRENQYYGRDERENLK